MRSSAGCLHFFLNGIDMGVAVRDIPNEVYGIVDLYGAAVQTTICGSNDDIEEINLSNEGASCMENISNSELDSKP